MTRTQRDGRVPWAGDGYHSHPVPADIDYVVRMRDGAHVGTEVYRTEDGFRFVFLDGAQTHATAERCILLRLRNFDANELPEPFASDLDSPDGLALVGVEHNDDLWWIGEAEVLWDSAVDIEEQTEEDKP